MMLADGVVFVWVGIVLVAGFVTFFVVLASVVFRFLRALVRMLTGAGWREPPQRAAPRRGWGRLCHDPRCGHVNADTARYCARCGKRLNAGCDYDG